MLGKTSGLIGKTGISQQQPVHKRALAKRDQRGSRLFDMLLAGLGLLVFSPAFILIALLLLGHGFQKPIFLQKRVGLNGNVFVIIKFRTLRDGTCRTVGPALLRSSKKLVSILRITGFDELPQFINVLRGEMSLVGPRPHSLADHRRFSASIADYRDRLTIKPGMTGWAQIHGWRGPVCNSVHLKERLRCDLQYIARHNPVLDCAILIRTALLPLGALRRYHCRHRSCDGMKPCLQCPQRPA